MPSTKTKALPKTLAAAADELYNTMQARYALQKQIKVMEERETALEMHLINNLPKSEATGVTGKFARATIKPKVRPNVIDWDAFYAEILKKAKKEPGYWSLLQRRVGNAAIEEMWAAGKTVPGVERFNYKTVSINKV